MNEITNIPIKVEYHHIKDKRQAKLFLELVKAKLLSPVYYEKFSKIIKEAQREVMKDYNIK